MKNLVSGKWVVLRCEYRTRDDNWELYEHLPFGKYIWDFGHTLKSGREYLGALKRRFGDSESGPVDFMYDPGDALLSIDEPSDECNEDRYRIVPQDSFTLILYLLEGVGREPQDYHYRLVLKKHTALSSD